MLQPMFDITGLRIGDSADIMKSFPSGSGLVSIFSFNLYSSFFPPLNTSPFLTSAYTLTSYNSLFFANLT